MGRYAAQTGQEVTFEKFLNHQHEYAPNADKDGRYPVPQPGIKNQARILRADRGRVSEPLGARFDLCDGPSRVLGDDGLGVGAGLIQRGECRVVCHIA